MSLRSLYLGPVQEGVTKRRPSISLIYLVYNPRPSPYWSYVSLVLHSAPEAPLNCTRTIPSSAIEITEPAALPGLLSQDVNVNCFEALFLHPAGRNLQNEMGTMSTVESSSESSVGDLAKRIEFDHSSGVIQKQFPREPTMAKNGIYLKPCQGSQHSLGYSRSLSHVGPSGFWRW